jgi:predicted Zn-ribbon and HTH transcriptional regulator
MKTLPNGAIELDRKTEELTMTKITCPRCGYEWTPRKKDPKSCPCCKQYLQRRTVKEPWKGGK